MSATRATGSWQKRNSIPKVLYTNQRVPKAKLWIINYCVFEVKADNEPTISLPVYLSLSKNENGTLKTVRVESRTSECKVNVLSIAPRQLILVTLVKLIILNTFAHEILPVDAVWSRESFIYEELKDIFEKNKHGFDS